jgi:hypothetical protein
VSPRSSSTQPHTHKCDRSIESHASAIILVFLIYQLIYTKSSDLTQQELSIHFTSYYAWRSLEEGRDRNLLDFFPLAKPLRLSRRKSRAGANSPAPARDPAAGRRCTVAEAEEAATARKERAASTAPRRRRWAIRAGGGGVPPRLVYRRLRRRAAAARGENGDEGF